MGTSEIVKDLRELGCKVSVRHHRFRENKWIRVNADTKKLKRVCRPNGGTTIAKIITSEGQEFTGESKCMETERYSGIVGTQIALGRAYKAFTKTLCADSRRLVSIIEGE